MSDVKLPSFRYHPDPVRTGVVKEIRAVCPVCGKTRDYIYTGPFYGVIRAKNICPWCIADGSAAREYDGEFQDPAACEKVDSESYLDELTHRTPGYGGWQQEQWLSHCGDFCAFISYVGWAEIEHLADELAEDIAREAAGDLDSFKETLTSNGSHVGYLFRCLHCGKHRLVTDWD